MNKRLKRKQATQARPQDYPEDSRPGRGDYIHTCKNCRIEFFGHKARRICKLCDTNVPQIHIQGWRDMPRETQDAMVKMFQIIAENLSKGIDPIKHEQP